MKIAPIFASDLAAATEGARPLYTTASPVGLAQIDDALRYYAMQKGRIVGLPLLCIGAGHVCGAERGNEKLIAAAAAADLVQFSLCYHDDVVDRAESRHGLPSINRRWSDGVGIWAGDILYFRLIQQLQRHLPAALSKTLTVLENIAVADMRHAERMDGLACAKETCVELVRYKSGSCGEIACWLGATAAGAAPGHVQLMAKFGAHFGTAFQLAGDARDYGARRKSGDHKDIGPDFAARIVTLPVIFAYQRGTPKERAFWQRTIAEGIQHDEDLAEAIALMRRHDAITDTIYEARQWGRRARRTLDGFESDAADAMAALVDHYVEDVEP